MIRTSGADLHPATGARFVFEREPGDPPRYRVHVLSLIHISEPTRPY